MPSPDLYLGQVVPGFQDACQAIAEDWKSEKGKAPGSEDRLHVEAHILEARDVFITNDGSLRACAGDGGAWVPD